ncbi:hypothetical protein [Streptomyces sp. ICBB 8177]|uniref:hypothetical protein n=1 Tax=Streptomyces sp. ICBB 8177 TaxID=563922 RepID=UPI0011B6F495|nr:hypothetical protein [Streptomyces sp. ICBB 8177]
MDFLTQHASLAIVLALSDIFWPAFIEVRNCILRERSYEEQNLDAWFQATSGDRASIESTLNQLKLWQVIECKETVEDDAALHRIARVIANCWRAALKESFPQEEFDVRLLKTPDGPIVTFSTS